MKKFLTIALLVIIALALFVGGMVLCYYQKDNINKLLGIKNETQADNPPAQLEPDKPPVEDDKHYSDEALTLTVHVDDTTYTKKVEPGGYADLEIPTKDGYTFSRWEIKFDDMELLDFSWLDSWVNFNAMPIYNNMTFIAHFEKTYTVNVKVENKTFTFKCIENQPFSESFYESFSVINLLEESRMETFEQTIPGELIGYVIENDSDTTPIANFDDVVIKDNMTINAVFKEKQTGLPWRIDGETITLFDLITWNDSDLPDKNILTMPSTYSVKYSEPVKYVFEDFRNLTDLRHPINFPVTINDSNGKSKVINTEEDLFVESNFNDMQFPVSYNFIDKTIVEGTEFTVKRIGSRVMVSCYDQFDSIVFPEQLEVIEDEAFLDYAPMIEKLNFPASLRKIGARAFSDLGYNYNSCVVTFQGNNLEEIGEGAFVNSTLSEINLPKSLNKIGDYAFSNSKLNSITIPSNVKDIGRAAFSSCQELQSLDFEGDSNLIEIGDFAFYNCRLEKIILPNSLEKLGRFTFFNNDNVREFQISENLKTAYLSSFSVNYFQTLSQNSYETIYLYLPNTMEELILDKQAQFQANYLNWYDIYTLTIGERGLTSIDIVVNSLIPFTLKIEDEDILSEQIYIAVPDAAYDQYTSAEGWNRFNEGNYEGGISSTAGIYRHSQFTRRLIIVEDENGNVLSTDVSISDNSHTFVENWQEMNVKGFIRKDKPGSTFIQVDENGQFPYKYEVGDGFIVRFIAKYEEN